LKKTTPKRIICTVPSITELLYHLGLEKEVIGITKFCIHPNEWYTTKTKIGGTKNLHLEKIKQLQPDLIFANKEENVKEQIEVLQKSTTVYVTDIVTITDALEMILTIGKLTRKLTVARKICTTIEKRIASVKNLFNQHKVAYLIWQNPFMTIGGDTFIHQMLSSIGLQNAFATGKRYPVISIEELQNKKCDFIFLSSEPYPFKEKHRIILKNQFPTTEIILVNGELFSWYGSKLLESADYFKQLQKQLFKNSKTTSF
jgi:ABC-type Fe3+-hydroxamate transport system substrate-binding protein